MIYNKLWVILASLQFHCRRERERGEGWDRDWDLRLTPTNGIKGGNKEYGGTLAGTTLSTRLTSRYTALHYTALECSLLRFSSKSSSGFQTFPRMIRNVPKYLLPFQGVGGGGVWVWSCQSRYLLLMVELGGTKINPGHREKPFLKSIILMESKFCWRDGVWCDNIYNTRTWNTRLGEQG